MIREKARALRAHDVPAGKFAWTWHGVPEGYEAAQRACRGGARENSRGGVSLPRQGVDRRQAMLCIPTDLPTLSSNGATAPQKSSAQTAARSWPPPARCTVPASAGRQESAPAPLDEPDLPLPAVALLAESELSESPDAWTSFFEPESAGSVGGFLPPLP